MSEVSKQRKELPSGREIFKIATHLTVVLGILVVNTGCGENNIEELLTVQPILTEIVDPTIAGPTETLSIQEVVIEAMATPGASFSEILPTSTPIGDPAIEFPDVEGIEEIIEIITRQKSDIQMQFGDIKVETKVSDRTGEEGRTIIIYSYGRQEDGAIIMPAEGEDGTATFIEPEPPFGVEHRDVQVTFAVSGNELLPVAVFYGEDGQPYWYDSSEQEESVWRDEENNPFEVGLLTEEMQDMGLRLEKDEDGRTIAVDEKGYPRFYLDEVSGEWMVNYFSIWHPEVSEPMVLRDALDLAAKDCEPIPREQLLGWESVPFYKRYFKDLVKAYGDPDVVYTEETVTGVKLWCGATWPTDISPNETSCLLFEMEIEQEDGTTETVLLYKNVDGVVVKIPIESFSTSW